MDKSKVGYKKPPKEHQFKPGEIANPKGRKPGSFSLKRQLRIALSEISKGGEKVPYYKLLVKRVLTKAIANGDNKMIEMIFHYMEGRPTGDIFGDDEVKRIIQININSPRGKSTRNKSNRKAV